MNVASLPHFDQYLGPWSIEPERFLAGHAALMGIDLHVHMQGPDPHRAAEQAELRSQLTVQDGVAVIALHGVLMKHYSSMQESTSTVVARRLVRGAVASRDVGAILLHIDSPGGTVAGMQELAGDIAAASQAKPMIAFCENLCASAAYWAASQAGKIVASPIALVGSIGTYGVIQDFSAAATLKGIKVHVVKAGAHKGAGVPGTEITAEQLAEHQRIVNELNGFFVRGVAAGRGIPLARAEELADGRVHIAAEAQRLGLIDGVQSLDATFTKLAALAQQRIQK